MFLRKVNSGEVTQQVTGQLLQFSTVWCPSVSRAFTKTLHCSHFFIWGNGSLGRLSDLLQGQQFPTLLQPQERKLTTYHNSQVKATYFQNRAIMKHTDAYKINVAYKLCSSGNELAVLNPKSRVIMFALLERERERERSVAASTYAGVVWRSYLGAAMRWASR